MAFVVIYFFVFGAGLFYILRLAHRPPEFGERGVLGSNEPPIRTSGITPASQVDPDAVLHPAE
jgi:cytochrome d ubiquinol oxidase subunit I